MLKHPIRENTKEDINAFVEKNIRENRVLDSLAGFREPTRKPPTVLTRWNTTFHDVYCIWCPAISHELCELLARCAPPKYADGVRGYRNSVTRRDLLRSRRSQV